jgi:hypothetical protein
MKFRRSQTRGPFSHHIEPGLSFFFHRPDIDTAKEQLLIDHYRVKSSQGYRCSTAKKILGCQFVIAPVVISS